MARLLVVDDDPAIRMMTGLLLANAGHAVTEAADVDSAFAELERSRPEVLITDLNMPGNAKGEMISNVRAKYPGLPILVISGESRSKASLDGIARPVRMLEKPFSAEVLRATLDTLLREAEAG